MDKFLLTPSRGSAGGSALTRALGFTRLTKRRQETFKGGPDKFVVNWGSSEVIKEVLACNVLNKPEAVGTAVNKLSAFICMVNAGVRCPQFTTSQETALDWVRRGGTVVARHTLTGSSGAGIQILRTEDDFPCEAPLYTFYVKKKAEFRVHVMQGNIFDIQRKMRRKDLPDDKVNWMVRNHANGFVFGREGDLVEDNQWPHLSKQAVLAVNSLGLDFGAVDIIWNENSQRAYVLEVNTAPGLEGKTIDNYCQAILEVFRRRHVRKPERKRLMELAPDKFAIGMAIENMLNNEMLKPQF